MGPNGANNVTTWYAFKEDNNIHLCKTINIFNITISEDLTTYLSVGVFSNING